MLAINGTIALPLSMASDVMAWIDDECVLTIRLPIHGDHYVIAKNYMKNGNEIIVTYSNE